MCLKVRNSVSVFKKVKNAIKHLAQPALNTAPLGTYHLNSEAQEELVQDLNRDPEESRWASGPVGW
jgi:hypothetical protein